MTRWAGFARRHASKVIYAIALIGVPLGVIFGTGGLNTIGFWATAVVWLPLSMMALTPFVILLMLPLIPILYIIDKLLSSRLKGNDWFLPTLWTAFTLVVFVLGADLNAENVWLPTPWPNVGALLVMVAAFCVWVGLMWLGGTLEMPTPRSTTVHSGWSDTPEPDDEFWSDQMVEGWRSWSWENGRLKGMRDAWLSAGYEATCTECQDVPSWRHSCGIYAVKNPKRVPRLHRGAEVVGRVELWGSVIEHEDGYRAAKARITDLWTTSATLAKQMRNAYPVAVHVGTPLIKREETQWRI